MQRVCKVCGTIFESNGKEQLCSDTCRRLAKKISHQKYAVRHKLTGKTKNKVETPNTKADYMHKYYEEVLKEKRARKKEFTKIGQQNKVETTPSVVDVNNIDTTNDIVIEMLEKSITDNLELLDEIRAELEKIINELRAKQRGYEQKDIDLLHAMERNYRRNKVVRACETNKDNPCGT